MSRQLDIAKQNACRVAIHFMQSLGHRQDADASEYQAGMCNAEAAMDGVPEYMGVAPPDRALQLVRYIEDRAVEHRSFEHRKREWIRNALVSALPARLRGGRTDPS
ncbi:MAG TPA: hypothetical protein VJV78_39150 [Polyangiales bacterium]|nr:hypothetical protein [Polyangiales bacterium]